MKFTDLSPAKQQVLKAFTEGETIQYYTPATGWKDTDMGTFFGAFEFCHPDWLRVKVKEPTVTCVYAGITGEGRILSFEHNSIEELNSYYSNSVIDTYIKRTFHDGKFIKAEIVQE